MSDRLLISYVTFDLFNADCLSYLNYYRLFSCNHTGLLAAPLTLPSCPIPGCSFPRSLLGSHWADIIVFSSLSLSVCYLLPTLPLEGQRFCFIHWHTQYLEGYLALNKYLLNKDFLLYYMIWPKLLIVLPWPFLFFFYSEKSVFFS